MTVTHQLELVILSLTTRTSRTTTCKENAVSSIVWSAYSDEYTTAKFSILPNRCSITVVGLLVLYKVNKHYTKSKSYLIKLTKLNKRWQLSTDKLFGQRRIFNYTQSYYVDSGSFPVLPFTAINRSASVTNDSEVYTCNVYFHARRWLREFCDWSSR